MKVGFIGAGKAGCSLGKYFSVNGRQVDLVVTGYYSMIEEEARWAADFTESEVFSSADEVVKASDTIVISTPDGAVAGVWESLNKKEVGGRIICHLSGSLSSDVFSGIGTYGAYPVSIHPMFAFSNKESVYTQLQNACFTLEGAKEAVSCWQEILEQLGNQTVAISKEVKPKYHAAASILSNHVVAVLDAGYHLLVECGFSEEAARSFSAVLVRDNVEHVIKDGCVNALTGPVERGDADTVRKHLENMNEETARLYRVCGKRLLKIAQQKNPGREYTSLDMILEKE